MIEYPTTRSLEELNYDLFELIAYRDELEDNLRKVNENIKYYERLIKTIQKQTPPMSREART